MSSIPAKCLYYGHGQDRFYMTDSVDVIQAVCSEDPPEYLAQSIESILTQTISVHKYIMVRDGALLKKQIDVFVAFRPHLTLINNRRRRGLAGCLNTAIEYSSSDILVRMDSDDISSKERIESLLVELSMNPDLLVVGSGAKEIDSDGNLFFTKRMPERSHDILKMALTRSPFIHSSVAFRRHFFEIVGFYNESYLKAQDYELWARVIIERPELLKRMKNIRQLLITVRLPESFWSKRSVSNIRYGTPTSLKLICHFHAYHKLIPLFFKVAMRLSPSAFKKVSYRYFR